LVGVEKCRDAAGGGTGVAEDEDEDGLVYVLVYSARSKRRSDVRVD